MQKYTILKALEGKLTHKVETFQRKFVKYGDGTVTYKVSNPYRCSNEASDLFNKIVVDVEIEGSYKIKDYVFVASLEWQDAIRKNLVKTAPGSVELPERFLTSTHCDHCGTSRRRTRTIVLYNEKEDKFIQVGNSCVKDYIGCDVGDYAAYLSIWSSMAEYCESLNREGLGRVPNAFDLNYVCEQTCAEVRSRGFVSKNACVELGLPSTAARIESLLNKYLDKDGQTIVPAYDITIEDKEVALDFLSSIKALEPHSTSEHNVKSIISLSYIEMGFQLNTLVAAIGTYIKKVNQKKIERENATQSEFVGEVGDKITLKDLKHECIYSTEGVYGTYYKYKFVVNGNILIWGTATNLDRDSVVSLKGTVKAHTIYNGIKQTELTRCRITEEKIEMKAEEIRPFNGPDYDKILNEVFA